MAKGMDNERGETWCINLVQPLWDKEIPAKSSEWSIPKAKKVSVESALSYTHRLSLSLMGQPGRELRTQNLPSYSAPNAMVTESPRGLSPGCEGSLHGPVE